MIEIDKEQATIREHLLGRLNDPERAQLEERFITDEDFREVALIVEGELNDDYAAGLLSPEDRGCFTKHYLKVPAQREYAQFTEELRDYAIQSESPQTAPVKTGPRVPLKQKIANLFLGRRWVPAAVLSAVVFVAAIAVFSLRGKWFSSDPGSARNAEIALLNKPPFGTEGTFVVALTESLSRAPQKSNNVVIPEETKIVELRCHLPAQPYVKYRASLRVNDDSEIAKIDGVPAEPLKDGRLVRFRLPARLMAPDDYLLIVSGLTVDGRQEGVADYFIRVVKQSGANSSQPHSQ